MMASRGRSSIPANGPAARLAIWDSTPACGAVSSPYRRALARVLFRALCGGYPATISPNFPQVMACSGAGVGYSFDVAASREDGE
jgi:hypothetical protein